MAGQIKNVAAVPPKNWQQFIDGEREKEYFQELKHTIDREYTTTTIYPAKEHIFKAFSLCPYEKTQVVILGQDPYHNPHQAQGLAFSTPASLSNPPSMQNILKEIHNDIGSSICDDGDLRPWAQQGVLLLNTVLTVRAHQAHSHKNLGWELFTDAVISHISTQMCGVVFLLWGAPARKKKSLIDAQKHCVLEAPHPSPLSAHRGFFGCKHFSLANHYLQQHGKAGIIW